MKTWALSLFLLTGCGIGGEHYWFRCPNVPHLGAVQADHEILCAEFTFNTQVAFQFLNNPTPPIVNEGSNHDFERVTVSVDSGTTVDGHDTSGGYYSLDAIQLACDGKDLFHEMLHHWETINWILDTSVHPNWYPKGYYSADEAYHNVALPVTKGCAG